MMPFSDNLLLIAGPTGTGKNALALRISEAIRPIAESEILNADALQLYDGLKILTNFPSEKQLQRVPHVLFGILNPMDSANAAWWANMAMKEIDRIRALGKVAIVCGGTGFYLKALQDGLATIPEISPEILAEAQEKLKKIGRNNFFDELQRIDPHYAGGNNPQRMLRAYAVLCSTGKSLTDWWKNGNGDGDDTTRSAGRNCSCLVLNPNREALGNVCRRRIDAMFDAGAIEEVDNFRAKYDNPDRSQLAFAVGYREISSFLKKEILLDDCREKMHIRTMQYAKRQSTWFRNKMAAATFLSEFGHQLDLDTLAGNIN
ncbi:MAG: tRNA (adenosine(37)-N6)-dimethylallyltransferase MiaA [Holosporaceae bacterium]|jgi:tRNA dimethylallyltransferase|nr:tRNA (adenosine(37)-N6)-dimethylallyltransferase MiaA [Holosporaceae bacterium]